MFFVRKSSYHKAIVKIRFLNRDIYEHIQKTNELLRKINMLRIELDTNIEINQIKQKEIGCLLRENKSLDLELLDLEKKNKTLFASAGGNARAKEMYKRNLDEANKSIQFLMDQLQKKTPQK